MIGKSMVLVLSGPFVNDQKAIRLTAGLASVSDRVVVIDNHQINDNRISKQMSSVERYPLLRLNFNFYPERRGADGGDHTIIFDHVPTRNPYVNGSLLLTRISLGRLAHKIAISHLLK